MPVLRSVFFELGILYRGADHGVDTFAHLFMRYLGFIHRLASGQAFWSHWR